MAKGFQKRINVKDSTAPNAQQVCPTTVWWLPPPCTSKPAPPLFSFDLSFLFVSPLQKVRAIEPYALLTLIIRHDVRA